MFNIFKKKQEKVQTIENITPIKMVEEPKKEYDVYGFKVAGTSYYEKSIIEDLADENSDYDLTKREILDDGLEDERIFKYEFFIKKVELIPEPDNPHDENAVKVIADGVHIGYVPAGKAKKAARIISTEDIKSITCEMSGGPYKKVYEDYDDGKYVLDKGEYVLSARVEIEYKV